MASWKITLESSRGIEPKGLFKTEIGISTVRMALGLLKGIQILGFSLGDALKWIDKPMSDDMPVKVTVQTEDRTLPDIYITIKGDGK